MTILALQGILTKSTESAGFSAAALVLMLQLMKFLPIQAAKFLPQRAHVNMLTYRAGAGRKLAPAPRLSSRNEEAGWQSLTGDALYDILFDMQVHRMFSPNRG